MYLFTVQPPPSLPVPHRFVAQAIRHHHRLRWASMRQQRTRPPSRTTPVSSSDPPCDGFNKCPFTRSTDTVAPVDWQTDLAWGAVRTTARAPLRVHGLAHFVFGDLSSPEPRFCPPRHSPPALSSLFFSREASGSAGGSVVFFGSLLGGCGGCLVQPFSSRRDAFPSRDPKWISRCSTELPACAVVSELVEGIAAF